MSKIVNCPTCGARCKTETDKKSGEVVYKGLQDEDAFKKIQQLKEALKKKNAS
jgi:hypothetical protein